MPHIHTTKHTNIVTPSPLVDGVTFDFIAKSKKEDKICATIEDKSFFLTKLEKNGHELIKIDPTTRVTPIEMAKKALASYIKYSVCEVLSSNIESNPRKLEPQKEYLKDISYFVNQFLSAKEICIEVGFGSGRHLLYQAKENPHIQYIGIEIHTPSIEQVLKQVKVENIENILVVNYDARLFLEFVQSNTVSRIFVHFPVPWDKKPHRRVMSEEFINESLRALKVGGSLELRTDSPNYYEYSKGLYEKYTQKSIIVKNQDLQVTSKYEDRWKRMGKDIWDLTIFSNNNDEDITIDKDFSFHLKNKPNFDAICSILPKQSIVKDAFMVHFEYTFRIDENNGLIHLTMGSFNKPLTKYLFVQNDEITYFQSNPIPTSANKKAHLLIQSIFEGELH